MSNMNKGNLTIFTSYTPGAGKSFYMAMMAADAMKEGKKVVFGFMNKAHRDVEEMLIKSGISEDNYISAKSVEEILECEPDIVLMDEMGMKIKNRGFVYEAIEEMLEKGIDVFTSVNLKRFESANPKFMEITGIGIRTTIPDKYLDMASDIYFIDREPELMMTDFRKGLLFDEKHMRTRIMQKNFKLKTLNQYRDVSLEYLKDRDNLHIVSRREL